MPEHRPPRGEIRALTGIRALAALWVFGFHLRADVAARIPGWGLQPLMETVFAHGYLGVDLFFALSGFVLGVNHLDGLARPTAPKVAGFLRRRIARIYPLHLATLAGMLALVLATRTPLDGPRFGLGSLLANAALVHGWGLIPELTWNEPSWSVSTEWAAYLAFPLVAWGAGRIPDRRGIALGVAVALGAMAALLVLGNGGVVDEVRVALVRIGGCFTAGALLSRAYLLGFWGQARWSLAIGLGVAAMFGLLLADAPVPAMLLLPPIVFAVARDRGPIGTLLGTDAMRYGGRVSYAFYLVQAPVILVARQVYEAAGVARDSLEAGLFVAALAPATLLVAHVAHRAIEEPAQAAILGRS